MRASPSFSRVAARLYFFWSSAAAPAALERSSSGLARRLVRRIATTCPDRIEPNARALRILPRRHLRDGRELPIQSST